MIRILHTADLHLGVSRIDRIDSNGLNVMVNDFLKVLDEMVEFAIFKEDNGDGYPYIDAFLISGDIFQHPTPSPTIQQQFAKRVQKLIANKVQIVIIPGNHDKPITSTKSDPLQIFRILEVEGCHVYKTPELKVIKTNRGEIEILGFPYVSFKTLLGRDTSQTLTEKDIADKYLNLVKATIDKYAKLATPDRLTLLMAHMHVLGAKMGSERILTMTTEPMLPPTSLLFPNCNIVCLGHVHQHQVVYEQPPVIYSGSPQRCDFGEEKEKKGFIEIQWENNTLNWYFRETDARQYVTIECDVSELENPLQFILAKIDMTENLNHAIVRVIVTCSPKQKIDEEQILQKLAEYQLFHLYPVDIRRSNVMRSRAPGLSADVSFEDAIDIYLKTRKTDVITSKRLKELAIDYSKRFTQQELGEQ